MTGDDLIYLGWFSTKPMSAQCVSYFQRQRRMGWNVQLLLGDSVNSLSWVSKDERVAFHAATNEHDKYEIVRRASLTQHHITIIDMHPVDDDVNAAVAIYTVSDGSHELPTYPADYACYVVHIGEQSATGGRWIPLTNVMPPNQTDYRWLITSPHLIPQLNHREFVVYTRPGIILDTELLNRALVDMLHQDRAVGLCEHEQSVPSVNQCLHYVVNVNKPKLLNYIKWREQGGALDMGSDGGDGRRLFSSAVVVYNMHHPATLHFESRWEKEASWSGEETVSLFFGAQFQSPSSLFVLPGDLDTNSHFYHMKRLVTIPCQLPGRGGGLAPEVNDTTIPRKLHMIWVGDAPPPESCLEYRRRWSSLMPHWEVKLWRDGDVAQFGPDVQRRIAVATTGAQKADILRAFIVSVEGGIYVDADMEPHRSLEPLVALQEPLLICHDLPLTWEYVMNAFFGAVPHHPVVETLCALLLSATLNTQDVHMHTGPRALGRAIRHAPNPTGGKYYMLPSRAFYYNHTTPDAFATHKYANTWSSK
jgi:hypothetical protein